MASTENISNPRENLCEDGTDANNGIQEHLDDRLTRKQP